MKGRTFPICCLKLLSLAVTGSSCFKQEGCEYLFAETEDGRLDLRDAVVYYPEEDMYLRPEAEGEMPDAPLHFDELEWAAEFAGDTIMNAAPWRKVWCLWLPSNCAATEVPCPGRSLRQQTGCVREQLMYLCEAAKLKSDSTE